MEALCFSSNRAGTMDVWQQPIGTDGKPEGTLEPVTSGLEIRSASFSPDGSKLAYTRGRMVANIWRIPILSDRLATWADAKQMTSDTAYIQFVDISPDGKQLVLSSDRAGNQDLWIVPSDGEVMTQLTTVPTPDWGPRWSPDGETIVFWAYRSGNRDIWTMPAAGGPARQITTHPTYDVYPTWTHDGTQITFDSWRSGNRDIWIVDAKGGEPRQLTTHPVSDITGAWSPDGQWLVFAPGPRLWLMSADGSERKPLSAGPASSTARWSPDGETVFAKRNGNFWAFKVEDGSEHRVTDLVGRAGRLGNAMTTDGSWIYFSWGQDLGDIWVMDVVHGA
jgi:Tol biopolymer transport system component